jgi:HD-GYP domain-containing protein (c-di-GMP phosphodiesterase class II)
MADGWGAQAHIADDSARSAYRPQVITPTRIDLKPVRRADLLPHFAGAFDLAEEQQSGHACRVAHLALGIARALKRPAAARRRLLYVALLHDAGMSVRVEGGHLEGGAWVAARFGLEAGVQAAIRATHERWDGQGRPHGLHGESIPVEARVVAAAHWACDATEEIDNPLRARAHLQRPDALDEQEPVVGPDVRSALAAVLRDDLTWMTLWSPELPGLVAAAGVGEGRPSLRRLEAACEAMGEVVDAAVREPGRARRVAELSAQLAADVGLSEEHCRAIAMAGHLLDVGQLGVPRHVTEKPSILSVDEMEQMRRHPGLGSRILDRAPGMGQIAAWIEAHHERPDGRGYPEMLTVDELALPPRILAVADTYCALRADRPYRSALSTKDALAIIEGGAGHQFDDTVVAALRGAVAVVERSEARAAS